MMAMGSTLASSDRERTTTTTVSFESSRIQVEEKEIIAKIEINMSSSNGKDDTTEQPANGQNVHISKHPVLSHKITILRSSATSSGTFRAVLRELTYHLGYEATSHLTTTPVAISVPLPKKGPEVHLDCQGSKLKEKVALIPILRSGLGMIDSMMELLPNASVHHIGMYKVAGQNPVQYYNRLPRQCTADVAFILDPLIATASTLKSVISILKKWGVPQIHVISVIASRAGLDQVIEAHPDVHITVGEVDEQMDDSGMIIPGLGDSGDRLFGTAPVLDDDESLLHPSKRKRTMSDLK